VDNNSPLAIHFFASHLHWLTHAEASHGWFGLEAVLEVTPAGACPSVLYVLASQVPAGRMYATKGPLLRQPAYSFQMIAGPREHTILRRALESPESTRHLDSSHPNHYQFKSLSWALTTGPAKLMNPASLTCLPSPPPLLNLLLEFYDRDMRLSLQAPLRHWNYRLDPSAWQIETGPLLWPRDLQEFLNAPTTTGLTTAWLHANQQSRVTMSGYRLPPHEIEAQVSLLVLS